MKKNPWSRIENAPTICEFGRNPELPSPKRKKARDTADNHRKCCLKSFPFVPNWLTKLLDEPNREGLTSTID